MTQDHERTAAVAALIETARTALGDQIDRGRLQSVLDALIQLAARSELWADDAFPAPDDGSRQARHLIHEDADGAYALYLNVMTHGKTSTPHDHTTWACIAGVAGKELNILYERVDDESRSGYAKLQETGRVEVGPGTGVGLMPQDIHAIQVIDDAQVRHLHFYGRAVEQLTGRKQFDLGKNTYQLRAVGVPTRRR